MPVTVDNAGFGEFFGALEAGVQKATLAAGVVYQTALKEKLGRNHGGVRSRPGEPPNTQTGTLSRSIVVTSLSVGRAQIGPSIEYGKWLEFGTYPRVIKNSSGGVNEEATFRKFAGRAAANEQSLYHMAPRPFVRPVAADTRVADKAAERAAASLAASISGAKGKITQDAKTIASALANNNQGGLIRIVRGTETGGAP